MLVIRVLKCFVMPTLTYTAQVYDSVLHACFETHQIIEYMCCTCLVITSSDSRIFSKRFVTQTLTYTAQVCCISVLKLTKLLSICVELAL